MLDFLSYIKTLITGFVSPEEPRKRKATNWDDDCHLNKKYRRIGSMYDNRDERSNKMSGCSDCQQRSALGATASSFKLPHIPKEFPLEISDDEDDVIHYGTWKRSSHRWRENPSIAKDDDVQFVKTIEPSEIRAKKENLLYFKSQNVTDSPPINNKTRFLSSVKRNKMPNPFSRNGSSETIDKCYRTGALNETVRLDEKQKYSELLKNLTKNCNYDFHTKRSSVVDTSPVYGTPCGTVFADSRSRAQKILNLSRTMPNKDLIIDLTNDSGPSKSSFSKFKSNILKESSPILKESKSITSIRDSSDSSDVECLGIVSNNETFKKPVPRSNSLKATLDSKSVVKPDWANEIKKKYERSRLQKQREIEQEKLRTQLLRPHNKEQFESALESRVRHSMHITNHIVIDDSEDEVSEELPSLTDEQEKIIDRALIPNPPGEVLNEKFNIRITRRDIHTLSGLNWLNDEVINFYMNMLMERGKGENMPSVYATNTFFYPKLMSGGHSSLKRWTKRVDIFAHDIMVIPVHLGMHWCMSMVDFRKKTVKYYDSMGGQNNRCIQAVFQYIQDEMREKKKVEFDKTDWALSCVTDIPQQMNGSDCGMFSCTYAEFYCRNAKFTFTQEDMPYLRRKMILEILTGELLIK